MVVSSVAEPLIVKKNMCPTKEQPGAMEYFYHDFNICKKNTYSQNKKIRGGPSADRRGDGLQNVRAEKCANPLYYTLHFCDTCYTFV